MKIVVVDERIPTPDRDAGSRRMAGLVSILGRLGHRVDLLADALPEGRAEPDLVVLSRWPVAARHLAAVRERWPQARVIFDTVDLHHVREYRGARLHGNAPALARALRTKRAELDLVAACDQTWVVTENERERLLAESPGSDVRVVAMFEPNAARDARPDGRRGALFVGGFAHFPNLDAARFLLQDLAPLLPDIPLTMVGPDAPPELESLCVPPHRVMGWVPDLTTWYEAARVAVAPLRFGAGIKGKVLEAMARGVPVVGTPLAFEGLAIRSGDDALPAETPADFAAAIRRLHEDDDLWRRLSSRGQRFVADGYSETAILRQVEAALAGIR